MLTLAYDCPLSGCAVISFVLPLIALVLTCPSKSEAYRQQVQVGTITYGAKFAGGSSTQPLE